MSDSITVDQLGPKAHRRYAEDQNALDALRAHDIPLRETSDIPKHFAIPLGSSIQTKWENLFETEQFHPFAAFEKPPGYATLRKPFFTTRLSAKLNWMTSEESNETLDQLKAAVDTKKHPSPLLEKEQGLLRALLDEVACLNQWLHEYAGQKGQYHKG